VFSKEYTNVLFTFQIPKWFDRPDKVDMQLHTVTEVSFSGRKLYSKLVAIHLYLHLKDDSLLLIGISPSRVTKTFSALRFYTAFYLISNLPLKLAICSPKGQKFDRNPLDQ
jgi:hypothetical protein